VTWDIKKRRFEAGENFQFLFINFIYALL
jgi:hypothetical protein